MSNLNPKLLVAKHSSGRMVDITNVKNGLSCDCICECCGERLVARQGNINDWSFAHESGANCSGAIESALHKVAKQIIEDEQVLYVGGYDPILAINPYFYRNLYSLLSETIESKYIEQSENQILYKFADKELADRLIMAKNKCAVGKLNLSKVISEVKAQEANIKPDITCTFDDMPLFIEIVVTHECDENKIFKLKELNIPTIEIHLNNFSHVNFSISDVRNAIINTVISLNNPTPTVKRVWLVKPKFMTDADKYALEFITEAQNKIDQINNEIAIKNAETQNKIDQINKEKALKKAEIEARKTKLKKFGTTIVITQYDFGATVWIPEVDEIKKNIIIEVLASLKAKRRENDWLVKDIYAREKLVEAFSNKEIEIENQISLQARNRELERQNLIARDRENRSIAEGQYALNETKRRNQELEEQKIELGKIEEKQRIFKIESDIKEKKHRAITKELILKHKSIVNYQWRMKTIRDELALQGYSDKYVFEYF